MIMRLPERLEEGSTAKFSKVSMSPTMSGASSKFFAGHIQLVFFEFWNLNIEQQNCNILCQMEYEVCISYS